MNADEHEWLRRIENKIDKHADQLAAANKSIGDLTAYGCAQAPRHDDHETRIRTVENWKAEMIGRVFILSVLAGAASSAIGSLLPLIFKH